MLNLTLDLNSDLTFDYGAITIACSSDSNNAFELKSDGIFLNKNLISSGAGFIDQTGEGVRIGFLGPFYGLVNGEYPSPGRVSANSTVHRVFTATDPSSTPTGWRTVDTVLPGDILRCPNGTKYDYYLITNVTTGSSLHGFMNNAISSTVLIGTW